MWSSFNLHWMNYLASWSYILELIKVCRTSQGLMSIFSKSARKFHWMNYLRYKTQLLKVRTWLLFFSKSSSLFAKLRQLFDQLTEIVFFHFWRCILYVYIGMATGYLLHYPSHHQPDCYTYITQQLQDCSLDQDILKDIISNSLEVIFRNHSVNACTNEVFHCSMHGCE